MKNLYSIFIVSKGHAHADIYNVYSLLYVFIVFVYTAIIRCRMTYFNAMFINTLIDAKKNTL